jgi:hypothetical protein
LLNCFLLLLRDAVCRTEDEVDNYLCQGNDYQTDDSVYQSVLRIADTATVSAGGDIAEATVDDHPCADTAAGAKVGTAKSKRDARITN